MVPTASGRAAVRACTQPLTTGPMLAGRSTLIGWTRTIILSLAVTHAYGLPAAALPQAPQPMEVGQAGISGLSISSVRPSPHRAQDEAAGRSVRQKGDNGEPLSGGPQMPNIVASSLGTVNLCNKNSISRNDFIHMMSTRLIRMPKRAILKLSSTKQRKHCR